MTIRHTVFIGLVLSLLGAASVTAGGDDYNQKTVLTFSKPFEIPGHILPAGTYIFQLADSLSDRHVVQVRSGDDKQQIALVLAIANYRLEPTEKTVITFNEVPVGAPETIRAWFYPGRSAGQEFVYPKRRALELAATSKVIVPAIAVDTENPDLKTVPIVAITPERKEVAVASVIQTTPVLEQTQASAATQNGREANGRQLPKTASSLGLVILLGVLFLFLGVGALILARRSRLVPASAL